MGRAHELVPGNHNKAVVLEVSFEARWGPAVLVFPAPAHELSVPLIETDFDLAIMGVDRGQGLQQVGLIPRDDDETRHHRAGPPTGVQGRSQWPS